MKKISVITGGGSGMGFEAAKILGKEYSIILAGRTVSKLENAVNELKSLGIDAEAYPADMSDRSSVNKLAEYAASKGNVKCLIHAAGVSPNMTNGEAIFSINAVGTINVDEAFASVMTKGSCILNVSSMSAYMLPAEKVPTQLYKLALQDVSAFEAGAKQMLSVIPDEQKTGSAYTISKNFVCWYTSRMAVKYGSKGIRVVSISPGTFSTPMGEVEGERAAALARRGPLGRVGDPVEIAKMMAFMVSDEASYLTGSDILYDGGAVAAFKEMTENRQ